MPGRLWLYWHTPHAVLLALGPLSLAHCAIGNPEPPKSVASQPLYAYSQVEFTLLVQVREFLMLRSDLRSKLDQVRISYAQLACGTSNLSVCDAALNAAKSVELTSDRVMNPLTNEQKRRPAEYATKRLTGIAIRFNRKLGVK